MLKSAMDFLLFLESARYCLEKHNRTLEFTSEVSDSLIDIARAADLDGPGPGNNPPCRLMAVTSSRGENVGSDASSGQRLTRLRLRPTSLATIDDDHSG